MRGLALLITCSFALLTHAAEKEDIYFPDETWQTVVPASAGWDEALLADALSFAREKDSSSVVVLHRGKILTEGHWPVEGMWGWCSLTASGTARC